MKLLKDLYKNHNGKISDKWTIYLEKYEEKFERYQKLPIKFFEIGVLNGGSLEIFSKYFLNAELILGCDIDLKCKELKYRQPNIKIIVGDANEEIIKKEIIEHAKFDIIIDDGSHNSSDVVKSFCNFFNHLKDDGLFIVEDLHCSYYKEHGGGLFYPISSMNFFKKLVDVINYEYWGVNRKKEWLLRGFSQNYKADFESLELDCIHSIEFVNSLCFIKKKNSIHNKLGKRIVVGESATVVSDRKKLNNTETSVLNQNDNPWSNNELLPEEELMLLKKELKKY